MKQSRLVLAFILFLLSGPLAGRAQGGVTNDQAVRAYLSGNPDTKEVPDFGVVDTALAPVSLGSLKGKYVLIDFWASWCSQCMYESPYMEKLETVFKGKNIEFVSISCDEEVASWKSAIIRHHMDGRLQWHVSDLAVLRALKVARLPRFVLLDKQGRVLDADLTRPSDPAMAGYLRCLKGI
jgi:thiol-disulfide isomerase/thioredoxin